MPSICFPIQAREKRPGLPNDPFERLATAAQAIIVSSVAAFETVVGESGAEGERLALRRAMARYLIDSGIASSRGWI